MNSKILSWNINGLRSLKVDIKTFLDNLYSDIICLQETKVTRDMLEEPHAIVEGYSSYFSFSKKRSGYSGVATYCKNSATPVSAQDGLSGMNTNCVPGGSVEYLAGNWQEEVLKTLDTEGRCVITVHKLKAKNGIEISVAIINVYCPRVDPEKPERKIFKLQFYELLRQRSESLHNAGSHVIIVGDINTSHRIIDHCDPEDYENFDSRPDRLYLSDFFYNIKEGEPIPTMPTYSRSKLNSLLGNDEYDVEFCSKFKVIDTFRYYHPDQKEAFTCWNTYVNARETNYGTRIDYVLCNSEFILYLKDSQIQPNIEGSDHCPVTLQLSDNVEFLSSGKFPQVCTKYFPEFKGSQQKLHNYFKQEKLPEMADNNKNKRKLNINVKSVNKQTKLNTFFSVIPKNIKDCETAKINENEEDSIKKIKFDIKGNDSETLSESGTTAKYKSANGWDFLVIKPKPPPLCTGHNMPSVLRTVKKKGSNVNRQFYACSKGAGKSNDPNAQCKFFQWC